MAATSTFVPALPTTNGFAHDATPVSAAAQNQEADSGSRSRRGGAIRGGGNRSRGRGNGRMQNGDGPMNQQEQGGATGPQPGDGAYLAGAFNQPMNGNQGRRPNQPRIPQGPNDTRQRARNSPPQRVSENQSVLSVDHSRAGVAGITDGAVAGAITEGQIHSDADRNPFGRGAPRNRNRNNRNRKPASGQESAEGSAQPLGTNNGENIGANFQPRKNGRERQQPSQQAAPRPPVNARRAAFGGKLQSYAPNGRGKNHDGDAENQFEEAQDRAMLGYSSVDRRNVFGMTKEADDLTSRLIRGLTARPYLDHGHPLTVKCSTVHAVNASVPTCDEVCNRPQNCGHAEHRCRDPCHEGPCRECTVREQVSCYCGTEEKSVKCGWKKEDEVDCGIREGGDERKWKARFGCGKECGRFYDCGEHQCEELCHPHSIEPLPCPRSPEFVTHCPCTQTALVDFTTKPRQKCTDRIPTCGKPCPQPQSGCDHPCGRKCHEGPCPSCEVNVIAICRCGESKITMKCWEQKEMEATGELILCERVCHALRSCGRHECSRICCPLAYKAKTKGKKRELTSIEEDEGGKRYRVVPSVERCWIVDIIIAKSLVIRPESVIHVIKFAGSQRSFAVIQSCPCGHLQQRATCGACTSNPVSKEEVQLKCVTECAQRQRNARLAEALGIKPMDKLVEYPAELKSFAAANHHFVQGLEKTFNDFFMGPRQATVLPHMPLSKRQFAISLAEVYRFGTELVDAEPNRSVSVRRRIDSRIPNPTLSSITAPPATAKRQLGGLGDLKRPVMTVPSAAPTPRTWGANLLSTSSASSARPSPAASPTLRQTEQRSTAGFPAMPTTRLSRSAAVSRTASPAPGRPLIEENARDWDASDDDA
ncbi:hypothetical protein QFC21_002312 [Naganishia friedmannii]|uniref:Uncharacterized protein n=1 Tax=Naganishia friedmannii TaxID=89922 RepID=A0ACC2VXM0_9TREE|nr:hypothetical protein QFC21_002312 [Naganishia friedmannii]